MNALYFYGMAEEFPYNYTVTVLQNYLNIQKNGDKRKNDGNGRWIL